MKTLYDPIEPYDQGTLAVSPVHTIHYEQCGNPQGQPVVFLHGGPGGGIVEDYRRYFDPKAYRVVLFDQRGSGKSTPHASLEDNTTWHPGLFRRPVALAMIAPFTARHQIVPRRVAAARARMNMIERQLRWRILFTAILASRMVAQQNVLT